MFGKVHSGAFNKVVTKMLMSNIQDDCAEMTGGGLPPSVLPSDAFQAIIRGVTIHSELSQLQSPSQPGGA